MNSFESPNKDVEIRNIKFNDRVYSIEIEHFLDKSELSAEGKYSYYYEGVYFKIKFVINHNNIIIYGRKYKDDDYLFLEHNNQLEQISSNISEIKHILKETFNVGHFVYSPDFECYYYWCADKEDEDTWKYGLKNTKCIMYYSNDKIKYVGHLEEEKLSGMCKIYKRDGSLDVEGNFINGILSE